MYTITNNRILSFLGQKNKQFRYDTILRLGIYIDLFTYIIHRFSVYSYNKSTYGVQFKLWTYKYLLEFRNIRRRVSVAIVLLFTSRQRCKVNISCKLSFVPGQWSLDKKNISFFIQTFCLSAKVNTTLHCYGQCLLMLRRALSAELFTLVLTTCVRS